MTKFALPITLLLFASAIQAADLSIVVSPNEGELRGRLARIQLAVTEPETNRDVTRDVQFESLTPDLLAIDSQGLVRPLANGNGVVLITGGDKSIEVPIKVSGVDEKTPTSFRHDVMPILNRAGCTGGGCHAAQYGQGGFKLSLWGFEPEKDYDPIVRQESGRRVSLVEPENSLILQKPTMSVAHGGGQRFAKDSYEYEVLKTWLEDGVPKLIKDEPTVVDLVVTPATRVYHVDEGQQLRVVAKYSDGSTRDVTNRVMYDSMSDSVATITKSGYLTAAGSGQAPIMIRFMGQAKVSIAMVPHSGSVDLADFKPNNFIDELVAQRWQQLGLQPSEVCSDEEFIRRAFLDTIGTLPKPSRVIAFLDDDPIETRSVSEDEGRSTSILAYASGYDAQRHKKREALIDELLGLTGDPVRDVYVNEWSAYWALKWGDLIRNNRNKLGDGGMWALYNWTRASLRENKPVDQFVRELITAQGSVFQSGPANYYKVTTKPDELAEATAQNFLGIRLMCAKCHHHPFEVYSQADYYGLAAFFTRVATKGSADFGALGQDTVVLVKRSGNIKHPRTRKTMSPTPLQGEPIDAEAHRDLRRPLAEWLTSKDNDLFARNIANRFWGYYMGTGLVEPIDDMRATNPPSNPELLDALAKHLVESDFDLRQLMRAILVSRTYQLSSHPRGNNATDTRFYTHYNVKRLPAEVLLDAINFSTRTEEKFSGIPAGTRAIELPDPNYTSYFLDTLGRPKRVIACECERTAQPNLAQVLHIANGEVLSRKVAEQKGRAAKLVTAGLPDDALISELYLTTVSRVPSDAEVDRCRNVIADADSRQEGAEDILWALCNSREFLFNH